MILKPRKDSAELAVYRALNRHMIFNGDMQKHYNMLLKGYTGEVAFDNWLTELTCDAIVLCDLQFEVNKSFIQVDTLLIVSGAIYLFEIKNYEGEFEVVGDKWMSPWGKGIPNPVLQLKRIEEKFRQLLDEPPVRFPAVLRPNVVCVNSSFTLYNMQRDMPVLLPSHFKSLAEKLNKCEDKLDQSAYRFADALLKRHLNVSPYTRFPEFNAADLKKGVFCRECSGIMRKRTQREVQCSNCGCCEPLQESIVRAIHDFQLLFPGEKVSARRIYEWTGGIVDISSIRRILKKFVEKKGIFTIL